MPDQLWHAAVVGPLTALTVIAGAGADQPIRRVSVAVLALACVLLAVSWMGSSDAPGVWCIAVGTTPLFLLAVFITARIAGWRFVSEQRIQEEAALAEPLPADSFNLLNVFEFTTAMVILAAAFPPAALAWERFDTPRGASLLAAVSFGVTAGVIGAAMVWIAGQSGGVWLRAMTLLVLVVTATVAVEASTYALRDIDEVSYKSFAVVDDLESFQGCWWRWSATIVASVGASVGPLLVLGQRWMLWPWR
jgi:hypothetical protein